MKPLELPLAGHLINGDKDYLARTTHLATIADRDVLCVGYSELEIDQFVAPQRPRSITALTLWQDHEDALVKKYQLVIGDLTSRTIFPANRFDAVLTLSVFEHLNPLPNAIDEIYRLLKPRGHLYAFFGPVWSAPNGHHIYERPQDRLLDFYSGQMPAHIHLLCSRQEILEFYREQGYGEQGGLTAIHWFYEAAHINRLMYDDYVAILSNHFQFLFQELMYTHLPLPHLEKLRSQFPGYYDFSTYGAKYLLEAMK